jgi:hypothetical protein
VFLVSEMPLQQNERQSESCDRPVLGFSYRTNTEIVELTVCPPGRKPVKVYVELVIGFTTSEPFTGRCVAEYRRPSGSRTSGAPGESHVSPWTAFSRKAW